MEEQQLINRTQKREEFLRFCHMLNRILSFHQLNESIKLIEFDDENRSSSILADSPSLIDMIRRQCQHRSDRFDDFTDSIDFLLRIDDVKRSVRIVSPSNDIDQRFNEFIK